jgi:hypothetical protein
MLNYPLVQLANKQQMFSEQFHRAKHLFLEKMVPERRFGYVKVNSSINLEYVHWLSHRECAVKFMRETG